jgi:hypothetical protein
MPEIDEKLGGSTVEQFNAGKTGELDINLAPGADEVGLAVMLSDMIKTNLENKPGRIRDFNALKGGVFIRAHDADVEMTMVFNKGSLTVYGGMSGKPMLYISTDSETLLDLANLQIKLGLPWYFDKVGLGVIKKLLKRELRIQGLIFHPIALTRLSKIMSVN